MKKTLSIIFIAGFLITGLSSTNAFAGEVKKGAVVCISQKFLGKYYRHVEANEADFTQDMVDRAQCVVKRKSQRASKISQVGDNVQVEILGSFKLWVKEDFFVE